MPISTTQPMSEGWWLDRLLVRLAARQDRLNRLDRYYSGDADLPEGAETSRAGYRAFQRKARTNFAELIVEAVRDRMQPVGFRTGAEGDSNGDAEAWRIWQTNSLDADSALVHRAQLSMGDAYVIVGPPDPELGVPLITPEDPRQVITEHDPMQRRRVVAALKAFSDEVAGEDVAYLYLPGRVVKAVRPRPSARMGSGPSQYGAGAAGFEWANTTKLPIQTVPVVRFPNRPNMGQESTGEFEDVIDVLDRINHMLLQRLVIATVQAFKQRAIKGVPDADADGNPIDYSGIFTADPGALWLLPEGADIWESGQVDLTAILSAVRHDVQDLAAVTRTPLFYLTPDAANGSAEGASLAREGLVFKTVDRLTQAGEAWEAVMALAFAMSGDASRSSRTDMEIMWAPPDRHSLAERYDAASKAGAAGVPWRTVMLDVLQFSPQQVDRMEAEKAVDTLLAPVTAAPIERVTPTGPATEPAAASVFAAP